MSTVEYFDRNTVHRLTGISRQKLETLVKNGYINPYKRGEYKRAKWLFTWEHLLEIKAILKLKEIITCYQLADIKSFLQELGTNGSLANDGSKIILATNKQVFLIDNDNDKIIELLGKSRGQIILGTLLVSDLINEVQSKAKCENLTYLSTQLIKNVA